MSEPAKRLTQQQRAFLLGYRRARSRSRDELQEAERRLGELQDDVEAANARRVVIDRDDEGPN